MNVEQGFEVRTKENMERRSLLRTLLRCGFGVCVRKKGDGAPEL